MALLTIIIPVYNEKRTIEKIVDKIQAVPIDKEIVIVDNASTDGTRDILKKLSGQGVKVIYHAQNMGKGNSVMLEDTETIFRANKLDGSQPQEM